MDIVKALRWCGNDGACDLCPYEITDSAECVNKLELDAADTIEALRGENARYRKAERDGRLVVLPCKVGDAVWYIADGKVESAELKAIRINISASMSGVLFEGIIQHGAYVYSWVIGQMLFLTRAEAEAKIGGNDGRT